MQALFQGTISKFGDLPRGELIEKNSDAAYFSNRENIENLVESLKKSGIPATISNNAGNSGCNQLLTTAYMPRKAMEIIILEIAYYHARYE